MTRKVYVELDPGVRKVGLAVFDAATGLLLGAWTVNTRSTAATVTRVIELAEGFGEVVYCKTEDMQKYPTKRSKHKDLDRVSAATDLLEERSGWKVVRQAPSRWKRQVPKDVCRKRILGILSKSEQRTLVGKGADMFDAIGIGLVDVGRATPGMVPVKKEPHDP